VISPDDKADAERLDILAQTNDGFKIAEEDLRLRGSGEFSGTAQAGEGAVLLGDFVDDFALYARAKADADDLVGRDPDLALPEHRALREIVDDDVTARAMFVSS
jgi:ATP-dependent DNA helicase RecG